MSKPSNFEVMVRKMRYYQKEYFKFRTEALLDASKGAEKEVDDYLSAIFEPTINFE